MDVYLEIKGLSNPDVLIINRQKPLINGAYIEKIHRAIDSGVINWKQILRLFNNSENWRFVIVACRWCRALSPSESVKSFVNESMKNRRLSDKGTEVYTGPNNF